VKSKSSSFEVMGGPSLIEPLQTEAVTRKVTPTARESHAKVLKYCPDPNNRKQAVEAARTGTLRRHGEAQQSRRVGHDRGRGQGRRRVRSDNPSLGTARGVTEVRGPPRRRTRSHGEMAPARAPAGRLGARAAGRAAILGGHPGGARGWRVHRRMMNSWGSTDTGSAPTLSRLLSGAR
jgi:hypothetical protein